MKRTILALGLGTLCLLASGPPRAAAREPVKIAFVDTGATGRSVTAEALAGILIRKRRLNLLVVSRAVDLDPFEIRPEPEVMKLLARRGIDVSDHRATALTADDVRHATLILTMTAGHRSQVIARFPEAAGKTLTIAAYAADEATDVVDAKGQPPAAYQAMIRELDRYVPVALAKALRARP